MNSPLSHDISKLLSCRSDCQIDGEWLVECEQEPAALEVPPCGGGVGEGSELIEDFGVDGAITEEDFVEAATGSASVAMLRKGMDQGWCGLC